MRVPPRFITTGGKHLRGARRAIQIAQPAAGAEWATTPPGGRMWHIVSGRVDLVTSAAVANRLAGTVVTVNGVEVWRVELSNNITAGLTTHITYTPSTQDFAVEDPAAFAAVPIPDMWLEPGDTIGSATVARDVADQYGPVVLYVEEAWFTMADLRDAAVEELAELDTFIRGGQQ